MKVCILYPLKCKIPHASDSGHRASNISSVPSNTSFSGEEVDKSVGQVATTGVLTGAIGSSFDGDLVGDEPSTEELGEGGSVGQVAKTGVVTGALGSVFVGDLVGV